MNLCMYDEEQVLLYVGQLVVSFCFLDKIYVGAVLAG